MNNSTTPPVVSPLASVKDDTLKTSKEIADSLNIVSVESAFTGKGPTTSPQQAPEGMSNAVGGHLPKAPSDG